MNYDAFFPQHVRSALEQEPPGSWMPVLPDGCIRLSAGYPAPSLVPFIAIGQSAERLIQNEQDQPLQYLGSRQMDHLRAIVKKRLVDRGIHLADHSLLITAGAAQAIYLVAQTLLTEDAIILVESPTYMEALEMFRNYTRQIVAIPMDADGLQTDELEAWLVQRDRANQPLPKLIYTIPSFHNPTGITWTIERRRHLLTLAQRFNFLIVEDDAYGELYFDEAPVTLKSLDTYGRVIHIGSLSKVVAPGLRIGWVAAPRPLIQAFEWFKKDLDHPFAEATTATYLSQVAFEKRLEELRDAYCQRRDCMIQALEQHMPDSVSWNTPSGGFFVWLHVKGVDTAQMLPRALAAGVAYVPGKHFFSKKDIGTEYLRLSYSYLNPDDMTEGVQRLAGVIRAHGSVLD